MKERIEAILRRGEEFKDRNKINLEILDKRKKCKLCYEGDLYTHRHTCPEHQYVSTWVTEEEHKEQASGKGVNIINLLEVVSTLWEREKKLVEALKWYTVGKNLEAHIDPYNGYYEIFDTMHDRARQALKEVE